MKHRYYMSMSIQDEAEERQKPQSLHRASIDWVTLERYDPVSGKWIDNPGLLAASGIGGDNSYVEVSVEEARDFLKAIAPHISPEIVLSGLPITLIIDGQTVTGEIVSLATNDIEIKLTSPCGNSRKGLHVPHFKMAYKQHWLADSAGVLTKRGQLVAEQLLRELYQDCGVK